MKKYSVCPQCGAHLDNGERCDCQRVEIVPQDIPAERLTILARPVLAAVRAAFEDPVIAAEYATWLAARQSKQKKIAVTRDCITKT